MDKQARYQSIINKTTDMAIDRRFVDLGPIIGPELPDWLENRVIYELYVRAFSPEGTFDAVTARLKELKEWGIDLIWLMPVYPIGRVQRKGTDGCPYAVKNYFTVNPEYGSEQSLKILIETAHQLNMRIILDMVANHVAPDYEPLKQYPEMVLRDEQEEPIRKIADWSDVVDLDYSSQMTRRHMADILEYWITEFDIDGYRCDVAGFVPMDFWEENIMKLRQIKPDFYMLAEWESPRLHENVFNSTYDWTLYDLLLDVHHGREPANVLQQWIEAKSQVYPRNSLFLRFLENHDKPRAAHTFKREAIPALAAFLFTIDGIPLVYNGQEIGAEHYASLFDKEPIRWNDADTTLKKTYKNLIHMRKSHPAMASEHFTFLQGGTQRQTMCYAKGTRSELLVVINFSNDTVILENKDACEHLQSGSILFSTNDISVMKNNKMKLLPHQAVITLKT
ncbi:MAG: DUF3459 domain-containing protein [Caldithrix sp.]|nr:DUF3459 domain-containing protein [Caldithrix sp.]